MLPIDSASNKRFVEAMQKDYGVLAGGYAASMYIGGQCVEAALAIAGDKSTDGTAFADALHKIKLEDTPRGAFSRRPSRSRSSARSNRSSAPAWPTA